VFVKVFETKRVQNMPFYGFFMEKKHFFTVKKIQKIR